MSLCSVLCFIYCYSECHYAQCRNDEYRYAKCRYAKCRNDVYRYAECRYAKCRYAQCCYAKCSGALSASLYLENVFSRKNLILDGKKVFPKRRRTGYRKLRKQELK